MSIDLTLDRLKLLVSHLPTYTRPTIHIAGTNGKGSVAALLSHILVSSNFTVGRFNSPHLIEPRDCITINNRAVSAELYSSASHFIEDADRAHGTKLSSFELLTLTAFHVFESEKIDIAVVEVGLGGRLDATNILPSDTILASVLTAVDLDHQAFLGSTVDKIAREKAAIARPGRPFVLGKQAHGSQVEDVVRQVVAENGAELILALDIVAREWDLDIDEEPDEETTSVEPPPQPVAISIPCFGDSPVNALLPMQGAHQLENLGTALGAISALLTYQIPACAESLNLKAQLTPQSISQGIKATKWPGRISFHSISVRPDSQTLVLVDGAHNPASAASLSAYVTHLLSHASSESPFTITYILALSHSPPKTPMQTLSSLLPPVSNHPMIAINIALLRFTPPEGMPWVKSVPPSEMLEVVQTLLPKMKETSLWVQDDVDTGAEHGLPDALKWAANRVQVNEDHDHLVVLAGSLYLVADFYRYRE